MEEGLRQFQEDNCRGCKFVDEYALGTDEPCCTYYSSLIVKGGRCFTRVDKETDEFICSRCRDHVKRETVSDQALHQRVCEACHSGKRKRYYIKNRATGQDGYRYADSAQEGCEKMGWMIGDCFVQEERIIKGE